MKKILTLVMILFVSIAFSQVQPTKAPVNPDYIQYIDAVNAGTYNPINSEGYGLGEIAPPFKPVFSGTYKKVYKSNWQV